MANNEKTSKKIASMASYLLKSKNSNTRIKKVAASALTQASDKRNKRK